MMYSRYAGPGTEYRRAPAPRPFPEQGPQPGPRRPPMPPPGPGPRRPGPRPAPHSGPEPPRAPGSCPPGPAGPPGLDAGDLLLLAVLFLLYRESGDEDFLVMLAVVAFGIFGGKLPIPFL